MKKPLLKIAFGMATMIFGVTSYAQTYSFTNCGATGSQGPTQGQVNATYTGPNTLTGNVTINNQGIQEWTVPTTGIYNITAVGAQGGKANSTADQYRGGGATMSGDFNLTAGQLIKVVVGQEGNECPSGNAANGGGRGGGGSFVWINTQTSPLIVAGGGGGGSITNTSGNLTFCEGVGAPVTNDGLPSQSQVANFGTAGGDATQGIEPALGWTTMFGSLDFTGSTGGSHGGIGGFGGGGTGADATPHAGGGGGGYSGGGGGQYSFNSGSGNTDGRNGGGGGGSFNAGTNQSNTAGNNFGMGSVTITLLCNPLVLNVAPYDTVCQGTQVTINGTSTGTGTISWDNGITNNVAFPATTLGTTVYTSSSTDPNDCPAQVSIHVLPALTGSVTNTICNNGSVVVNGNTYNASNPTGTEVFTNIGPYGCDSTVTVNLNVLPALTGSVTTTICDNGSVVVNGNTYNASNPTGTEVFTNVGPNNCDSTVTVNLNVLAAKTGSVTGTLCENESVIVNGTTYDVNNPTGTEVFSNIGAFNCDSTVTINLSFMPAIDVSVTNNSPSLMSNATGGATYRWLDCDNNFAVIPGESGQTYNPTSNGNYAVEVTVGSCMDTSACESVTNVGINENELFGGVQIFPNPTNNLVNISLNGIDKANLTLYTIDGKVVYQANNVSDEQTSINLRDNSKGIYFLKIDANNQNKVYKVIKE